MPTASGQEPRYQVMYQSPGPYSLDVRFLGYRVQLCTQGPASFIALCFVPYITCGKALRVFAQTETYATSNKYTS